MNYDLPRQQMHTQPEYNIDNAMSYGDMPETMLAQKFEETNMPNDEFAYTDFVRREIKDRTPDKALFEHERSRGGVSGVSGTIALRYEGHRGHANWEKPEQFYGFAGPEDREVRGIAVDPDMKEAVRQHEARSRFYRFTSDGGDQITGGGRSEAKVMADKQTLFRWTRDRLKIFSRQIDGRREGMRRTYVNVSDAAKQVTVQAYGDYIKDYALNPQRRANIISRAVVRDSQQYRSETIDQDWQFAQYTQICKRRRAEGKESRVNKDSNDVEFGDADMSKNYKAVGLLMSHLIRAKRSVEQDVNFADGEGVQIRKAAPCARDLAAILQSIVQDGEFDDADTAVARKTAKATIDGKVARREVIQNHETPSHVLLNADLIYKTLREGGDKTALKHQVVADAVVARGISEEAARKSKFWKEKHRMIDVQSDNIAREVAESSNIMSYRNRIYKIRVNNGSAISEHDGESTNSLVRSGGVDKYRVMNANDVDLDGKFLDNTQKERLGGRLGSKYTRREIDREDSTKEDFRSDA